MFLNIGSLARSLGPVDAMSSNSDLGFTSEQIVYELAVYLHCYVLDILAHGIYTTIYLIGLYATCTSPARLDRYIFN